jgi:hypothetical protein
MGASEPVVEFIPADADYQKEMLERGAAFMLCVKTRNPPVELPPPPPPPVIPTRKVDMTGSNMWANAAGRWLENREAARAAKEAEGELKSVVPEDAREAYGHGVLIKRDRARRLKLVELT